jgi:hypothetical protein
VVLVEKCALAHVRRGSLRPGDFKPDGYSTYTQALAGGRLVFILAMGLGLWFYDSIDFDVLHVQRVHRDTDEVA